MAPNGDFHRFFRADSNGSNGSNADIGSNRSKSLSYLKLPCLARPHGGDEIRRVIRAGRTSPRVTENGAELRGFSDLGDLKGKS